MVIDIILAIIFLASTGSLWYLFGQKLPELVLIPDEVIMGRLHEDSAKLRLFILHLKTFYREGHHLTLFWNFVGKALYQTHLALHYFDEKLVASVRYAKHNGGKVPFAPSQILEEEVQTVKDEVVQGVAPVQVERIGRMEVVRKKL